MREYREKFANPYVAAERGYIDEVIEPAGHAGGGSSRPSRSLAHQARPEPAEEAREHPPVTPARHRLREARAAAHRGGPARLGGARRSSPRSSGPPERPAPFDGFGRRARASACARPPTLGGFDYVGDLGFPGEFPYTRGIQPTMYRGRLWTMRQYAGFGSAAETNQRFRYLLAQGQTGLSRWRSTCRPRWATTPTTRWRRARWARSGVAISSVDDMAALFDGIPLDRVSTSMTINATASILLCLYIAVARAAGRAAGQALAAPSRTTS